MQTFHPRQTSHATVVEGEVFAVELPARPASGYRWDAALEAGVELLERESAPAPGAVGASTVTRFVLRAGARGRCSVRFTSRRPWEQHDAESLVLALDVIAP